MSKRKDVKTLAEVEKEAILSSLKRHGYNRNATARELGVSAATIRNKLKVYGIAVLMQEVVVPLEEHEQDLERYQPPAPKNRLRG